MGVLAECPVCRSRHSIKKKVCRKCGKNLDNAKKGKRVTYWICYRLPSGKQKQEPAGTSIDVARAADGKKKSLKKEGKLFDIREEAKMTFEELSEWYKNLEKVKAQKAFWRTKISLNHFNSVYGEMIVGKIKPVDLENYQAKRKAKGKADNTVDSELGAIRAMIYKAFDNDMVSGQTLKAFKRTKKLLKRNGNARSRILSPDEYEALCSHAALHVKNAVIIAYHTGMRRGEILQLRWPMADMKARTITLEASMTKDNEKRIIPISPSLHETLKGIPRALHDDHILMFRGKPLDAIGKALQRACVKAGIPYGRKTENGFTFHDLRHSFNTNMRKAGVPESVIMAITGHSTREMFDRYNTVDLEDTRQAVNTLEVFFQNVKQNVKHASNPHP
ncbi:MAG: site-specific integrase [Nitrospina sp.]|nr:site-specific integrase [Nitrospina sp.]